MKATANGLEGVVAAETALSDVRGDEGVLVIAGADVEALGDSASFEAATAQLFTAAGLATTEAQVKERLAAARVRVAKRLSAPVAANGMDALRAALATLSETDTELETAFELLAATSVATAQWYRRARGEPVLAPDPSLAHAADLHRMMTGAHDPLAARGLERYLVTVCDHGMNASTFAARVVASTGSDAVSAVVAAIGALKGPLHGGAPGPVLDMLDAIGTPERAEAWIDGEIAAGRRIMGMGHRVYKTRDPRAAVLEAATKALGKDSPRLTLARAVEGVARKALKAKYPDRSLDVNVQFYTAVLLDAVGIDRAAFSPMFACGRTAGWLAHVAEQRRTGRLIRPASTYVGAEAGCP